MRACKHCKRFTTRSSDDVARAQGWRWYDGPTVGGGHLVDVVCPVCSGHAEPEVAEWLVGCRTCDWQYEPWDPDERILTGKQALNVLDGHECEPELWIRPSGSDVDYRREAFDYKTGELRDEVRKREMAVSAK